MFQKQPIMKLTKKNCLIYLFSSRNLRRKQICWRTFSKYFMTFNMSLETVRTTKALKTNGTLVRRFIRMNSDMSPQVSLH